MTIRNLLAMSLYHNSENKLSSPKKAWKRLLSTLQLPKVLNRRLARSNTFPRRLNVSHKYHHYQQQQQMITRKSVDHQDIERRVGRKVPVPNDDQTSSDYKANNLMIRRCVADAENVEEDDEVAVGCTSMDSAFMTLRLHGVDAKAEEFIRRNKQAWRLERQKSVEEFFAMLARGS